MSSRTITGLDGVLKPSVGLKVAPCRNRDRLGRQQSKELPAVEESQTIDGIELIAIDRLEGLLMTGLRWAVGAIVMLGRRAVAMIDVRHRTGCGDQAEPEQRKQGQATLSQTPLPLSHHRNHYWQSTTGPTAHP